MSLPPYLLNSDPLELEDVPLQLALVTMELGSQRLKFQRLAQILDLAAVFLAAAARASLPEKIPDD